MGWGAWTNFDQAQPNQFANLGTSMYAVCTHTEIQLP